MSPVPMVRQLRTADGHRGAFVDNRLVGVASYEVATNLVDADIALVVARRMRAGSVTHVVVELDTERIDV